MKIKIPRTLNSFLNYHKYMIDDRKELGLDYCKHCKYFEFCCKYQEQERLKYEYLKYSYPPGVYGISRDEFMFNKAKLISLIELS